MKINTKENILEMKTFNHVIEFQHKNKTKCVPKFEPFTPILLCSVFAGPLRGFGVPRPKILKGGTIVNLFKKINTYLKAP